MKAGSVCFRVSHVSGSHTGTLLSYNVSSKGTDLPSASFNVSSSVQLISVCVFTKNKLGTAVSATINYTLTDIGKTYMNCPAPRTSVCESHVSCVETVLSCL